MSFRCKCESVLDSCVVADYAAFFDLNLFSDVDAFADYCAVYQREVRHGYGRKKNRIGDADIIADEDLWSDNCVWTDSGVFPDRYVFS